MQGDQGRDPGRQQGQGSDIQGEGNYDAARRFDAEERSFVEKGPVEKKAREAEQALDGPEGEELERARRESGARGGEADG
ncbi:hypothetical protein DJ017_04570 [Phenylobacterium soli]|uniref:Uncharacterized protein n=2 Tax=Phenylobacterium soli TaxID=2170551 RepID=A0A328ANR2_9CAUL|nr:hypothetical protein DJ017_04570 [Phenylobacterium soli]